MKITFNETKKIVDTLPIGLYAKRNIPLVLEEGIPTSFYDTMNDNITISFDIIAQGLESVKEEKETFKETIIRSMVYHEVSHAIYTPTMRSVYMTDYFNIFEDERMETVLSDYYYDVNFKKLVLYVNGGKVTKPTDKLSYFYNLVRFRVGEEKHLKKVEEIIKKYAYLNAGHSYVDTREVDNYFKEIRDLWDSISDIKSGITKEYKDACKNIEEKYSDAEDNINGKGATADDKITKSESGEKSDETKSGEKDSKGTIGEGEKSDSEMSAAMSDKGKDSGKSKSERILSNEEISENIEKAMNTMANTYYDKNLTESLSVIIEQFNKKNKKGSGTTAYSGVFNPRNVARDDYRYFDRKTNMVGNATYGQFHLNLWLDDSGSYGGNVDKTNYILHSLKLIESRNPNFTYDVYLIAHGINHLPKEHRIMKASGGNWLVSEIFDEFKKAQLKDAYNYNIVMFDGDAFSADVSGELIKSWEEQNINLKAFDTRNTTLITDTDNKRYIEKTKGGMSSAKIIYTDNFVKEIQDNVIATLSKAFR